jgi:hypothetical protein
LLLFYVDRLGFTNPWRHNEDGKADVAQVDRQGCALILADGEDWQRGDVHFFERLSEPRSRRRTRPRSLRWTRCAELEAKGAPVKEGWWGYRLLVVDDPDGNQLFFNYPNDI